MAVSKPMLTALTSGFNSKYVLTVYTDQLSQYPYRYLGILHYEGTPRHVWISDEDISSGKRYEQKVICIRKGEAPLAKYLYQTPKDMLPMIQRIQFLYRRKKLRRFKVFCMTMLKINKKGIQCLRVNRQIRRKILQFI